MNDNQDQRLLRGNFPQDKQQQSKTSRPRFIFNKLQMKIHIVTFVIGVVILVSNYVIYAQQAIKHNKPQYMTKSWINGFFRDAHDPQWQSFRSNLPLTIGMAVFWYVTSFPRKYSWLFGGTISLFCFRADAIIYFAILLFWYYYTKIFAKTKYFVISSWVIAIGLLYFNQQTNHLRFASNFIQSLIPQKLEFFKNSNRLFHFAQLLNMNLLKLLSFSIDNHRGDQFQSLKKHILKCKDCQPKYIVQQKNEGSKKRVIDYCYKGRDLYPFRPNQQYNFDMINFLNYVLFAPTFFAGPPISYKSFLSFDKMPTLEASFDNIKKLSIHLCFLILSFELYQVFIPNMKPKLNESLVIIQLASLFDLMFIWYKFLIIWKTYRLWAMMAGVNVIDNLQRCMMNNYGFQGFWRMWHRGFNHWLIRYLYIPLGGNKNYFSVILTVAFVAFWHDHSIYIVLWALIIVLFIVPEMFIKSLFRNWKGSPELYKKQWFKYLCALISGVYVYALALANIYGFGVGKDHTDVLFNKMLQNPVSLALSIIYVSQAIVIMFYKRDLEGGQKGF